MRIQQELVPFLSSTPQPVALALGRVVRSAGRPERLEACVKAAEVLTRYVAIASLASAAATRGGTDAPPTVENFDGNLSFGSFELAIFKSLAVPWDHPLREDLRIGMRQTKKNPGTAGVRLRAFVELRNELGHSITHVDEVRAANLFEEIDPIGGLIDCLEGLAPVLACPPLVVLRQEHRRGRLTALFNFHVGEGEPIPREIHLREPVFEWELPYLCTPQGLLPLAPGLTMLARPDGRRGMYLLDGIEDAGLRYKSVMDNDVRLLAGAGGELGRWLEGKGELEESVSPGLEVVCCADGRSLHGFLRNEPLPAGDESAQANEPIVIEFEEALWTPGSFEQACNNVGLGAAYRDVLYTFLQQGCRAQGSAQGIEIVGGPERDRTLLLFELQGGPVLTCTMQLEAFEAKLKGTRSVSLAPGQPADELVTEIAGLLLGQ